MYNSKYRALATETLRSGEIFADTRNIIKHIFFVIINKIYDTWYPCIYVKSRAGHSHFGARTKTFHCCLM